MATNPLWSGSQDSITGHSLRKVLTKGQWHNKFAVCGGRLKKHEAPSAIYFGITDCSRWSQCLGGCSLCFLGLKGIKLYLFHGEGCWFLSGCPSLAQRQGPPSLPLKILVPTYNRKISERDFFPKSCSPVGLSILKVAIGYIYLLASHFHLILDDSGQTSPPFGSLP